MEGVSKIFGGAMEVKDGNIRKILDALDEHQTMWKEPQHEIASYFAKIGTLLGSVETRDRGLIALCHFLPRCPLDTLEEKMQYYVNICAKICNQKGHTASIPLAYDVLKQLLLKSLESSDLNKLMISNVPKLMENVTTTVDPSTNAATLDFLETAMRYYPGPSGPSRNRIEDYLFSLVDSEDPLVVDRTGTCLLLLQQIRGGGQHGNLHKKTWEEYQCKLVDTIHDLLGKVFAHTPESFDVDENLEYLKFPKLVVDDEPVAGALRVVTRLLNAICYLERAILEPYPVAKPFKPMKILNVILRAHAVSCQTMTRNSIQENLALGMFLPQIQERMLKVLDALVLVLKSNMLPFGNLVTDLFDQSLKGTLTVDAKGRMKSFVAQRTKVYESMALWCETNKYASGIEEIGDKVLEHIVQDITPFEAEVTLQVNASGQKLSAKARKKLQKQQNAATSLAKTHTSNRLDNSKLLQTDSGNEELCLAALCCLRKILEAAGCFIKPVMHKLLQEKIVSLCFSVFSQLNTGIRQNLYCEPGCRAALLASLSALIINPHHLCPPPLQYGIVLFNLAEVQDPSEDVRSKASDLARTAETLLHPRKEVFYFPVEENTVKDMMVAKKKHPLNSIVSTKTAFDEDSPPIRFEQYSKPQPAESSLTSKNNEPEASVEDEPIARVEEITIEEDKTPAVVYKLDDDEHEANFNAGELHKSASDKTAESQAIRIDSDDDDEVEIVPETGNSVVNGSVIIPEQAKISVTENVDSSDDDVQMVDESVQETPTAAKIVPPTVGVLKRRSDGGPQAEDSDASEKRPKVMDNEEDVDLRVSDLVAEFVDELNDDV
ncbi:proline-, glutamic acid- and leucine-rich protein 1-like [Topomyia yanbarensis]|uniref:proline-, glutamic acid- and leucine-rich protein 1-like n=1 Tax=Topomyia yanbarensis TaxID=2498891 RepID=UPI00273C7B27|nr:proline-, glutamic acid- and leucine-rich protein 1-like [Topomyia yanbarensis]